jgi:hypothetical protein
MKALHTILVAVAVGCSVAGAAEPIHFSRDIAPILSNSCYTCHGPDDAQRKAGLRLDSFDAATIAAEGEHAAIIPGNPDASPLFQRVTASNPDDRMPPADKGTPLSPKQVELLRQWISEGAVFEKHWAFQPPALPAIPTADPARVRNPIDAFVLARLEKEGLAFNPPADPAVLLRRVSLDLIGLPPTNEEMDAFLADTAPDAYEKQVARLLESPRYGERWAQVWLDLARYADTMGYEKDPRRTMWPYRDWVIKALNANMPFDQFTREQLAGDLLENATRDQIIATGFHRNTMCNTEGGTDNEEYRSSAVIDRVNTTAQVWMGMTMACAQCHTHKYDPFTHREYYEFYSFFNQTEDADRDDEAPNLDCPSEKQENELARAQERITEAEAALLEVAGADPAAAPPAATASGWYRLGPFTASDFDTAFTQDFGPEQGVDLAQRYADGTQFWRSEPGLQDGPTGLTVQGDNTAHYFYRTLEAAQPTAIQLGLGSNDALRVWVNNELVLDKNVKRGAAPDQDKILVGLRPGMNTLLVKLVNGGEGGAIYFSKAEQAVPEAVALALATPDAQRDEATRALANNYRERNTSLQNARARLELVRSEIPRMPIMRELPAEQHRETRTFLSGSFLNPGEVVTAATPAVFHPFPVDAPKNRLGLAAWLTSHDNPLTARVVANRYWEQFFGHGIVTTTEDFGTQGEWPTHPELLDWLAIEFMNQGWDMKELCRLMVTSETYRQSSQSTPEKLERDPYNMLYARGPRFRLPAESIRDQALQVAGLLSAKMLGPSVMPPQPEGLWQVEYSDDKWVESTGEDKFRRGVYTFLRRTDPYPSMTSFDSTSREVCTVSRIRTNTPIQALVMLNDPVYIEAAQALARRVVNEGGASTRRRAEWAFRTVLGRPPQEDEVTVLAGLYRSEKEHYEAAPDAATEIACKPLGPAPEGQDVATLAAWTVVGNALMNTDEFVTKR